MRMRWYIEDWGGNETSGLSAFPGESAGRPQGIAQHRLFPSFPQVGDSNIV